MTPHLSMVGLVLILLSASGSAVCAEKDSARTQNLSARKPPVDLAEFFVPPEKYRSDFGNFRSPLLFTNGTRVRNAADWQRRRAEILFTWQDIMGPWPALIDKPRVETIKTTQRENILQHQLRVQIAL